MKNNPEQVYIDKVLQGDANAFSYLIDKYKNMVFTLALRVVKNREDAEEVAQDSFLKAYQKMDTFKGESKFSTWLYTIVYRNAITKIRKKQVETADMDPYVVNNHTEDHESPQIEAIKSGEQQKYVKEAVSRLQETDALLITLFYMEDSSIEEIQGITGMSESNVKVRLFRARKKLHRELSLLLNEEIKTIL